MAGGGLGGRSAVGFRHRLIREAAYAMLTRADEPLHEQHADWLSQADAARAAGPARQASHLEQAHEHLLAIGDPGRRAAAIAARAGRLLTDAAQQAHRSGELAAETGFLERARRMLGPQSAAAAELLPILASALVEAGTFDRAADVAALGASEGARLGLPGARWRSAVELERTRLYTRPDAVDVGASLAMVRQASEIFTHLGDDLGLAESSLSACRAAVDERSAGQRGEHCEQQVRHAQRIAAGFEVAAGQAYIAWSLVDGQQRWPSTRDQAM